MDEKDCIVISEYHYGEVYESRDRFEDSMFHRVYKRAYDVVQDSVYRQLEKKRKSDFQENIDNIVTFIGRRGTGKSSAMISFMQGLLENRDDDKAEAFTIYDRGRDCDNRRKVRFIGIDWIDASLLEKGEDIFEAILAKMLKQFLKEDAESGFSSRNDYDKKDLYRRFDSIYKKVLNVKKRGNIDAFASEMALSNLRDLARSSDIRQEFQQLIEEYIRLKDDLCRDERAETFLVVAIDDMDMNVSAGFEILEKIQRYMRVRHLIVLLAVNQEQMKLCCERHFAEMFESQIGYKVENKKKRISDLADQYMEKGLPSYTRVYLPSLKKMDYDRNRVTRIKIGGEEEQPESIKNAVFITMWKKTRVRYDVDGKKRHFMEPQSLRELNNDGIFRQHMKDLVWKKEYREEFLERLDFNYRRCMDDLLFRYADKILSGEESKFFLQLSETDIRRRGEAIVTRFCAMAEESRKNESANFEAEMYRREFLDGYRKFRYSYGEMLHAIYCVGRMNVYEKPLIHAILAMYSLTLTKIFYRYRDGSLENNVRGRNYDMLQELLCDSVGGSWSRQLLPKVYKVSILDREYEENEAYYAGAAKNTATIMKLEVSELEIVKIEEGKDLYQELSESDRQEIEWKFILFLFLSTDLAQWGKRDQPQARQNEEIIPVEGFRKKANAVGITIDNVDYNVMNFVSGIFKLDKKIEEFANHVCSIEVGELLKRHIATIKKENNSVEDNLTTNKNGQSATASDFWMEMIKWHERYGGMVVPVYAIDVYYNMFKRLVRDQKLRGRDMIEKSDLHSQLKELLNGIRKALDKNDQVYCREQNQVDKDTEEISFCNIFNTCPVIERLEEANSHQIDSYNEYVGTLIAAENNSTVSDEERQKRLLDE